MLCRPRLALLFGIGFWARLAVHVEWMGPDCGVIQALANGAFFGSINATTHKSRTTTSLSSLSQQADAVVQRNQSLTRQLSWFVS